MKNKKNNKKKILAVTGGAGFLGCHLCNELSKKYDKIYVIDIEPIKKHEYPKNVIAFKQDIRDHKNLVKIFSKVDEVIHAAAALPLWKKKEIFSTNVKGTKSVLDAAIKNNIKKVVFISSTSVYGIPKKHPIYETDPVVGVGPYGESKIRAEKLCIDYRKKGMFIPIIRPKSFIGTRRMGVFQILYDWVESGTKIPIIGNGKNRYQLLEVEDLVNAIYLVLNSKKGNDTFNIAAEKFETVYKDVNALCKFANKASRPLPFPSWFVIPLLEVFWALRISPLYRWIYGTACKDSFVSIDKAKKILKWKPKYSNAEALIRSYKWYLKHKNEILSNKAGITHTVPWKQGILKLAKIIL